MEQYQNKEKVDFITENGGKIHFFCFAGKTASILDKKEILSIIITVGNYL